MVHVPYQGKLPLLQPNLEGAFVQKVDLCLREFVPEHDESLVYHDQLKVLL